MRHAYARVAAVLVSLAPAIFSQTISTGEVTGTAFDSTGRQVVGAVIVLKSTDTGESRAIPSDASGVYRFAFLKPGGYEISGSLPGLKSDTGSLIVAVGQVESLNVVLKPEAAKEVVLVTDAAPLLNADNANIVYTLSNRQLDLLPLPGGDMVSVAYSVPGVVINNRFGNGNFAVGGLGSTSNLFTVNGVDDMDAFHNLNNSGTTGLLLGANEIQEASVIQNAYEGQYGRQAGAQINFVTKSGGNTYHGNLVYYYNDTVLNANEFFANAAGIPRPHTVSNQYAASLGGRIVKDKLFFFADTEGLRYDLATFGAAVVIPSPALESYALQSIEPSQAALYQKMFALYNNAPGHEAGVPVTNGNGLLQDNSGRLGCGKLTGTSTGTGGTFGVDVPCAQAWSTTLPNPTAEWTLSSRIDYNLSANQRFFFRFRTDHGYRPNAFNLSFISPLFNTLLIKPEYDGQLNHTWVITPRLVNNFIGSGSHNSNTFGLADRSAALNLFPLRFNITDGGANGGGFASMGPSGQVGGQRAGQLQIVDDLSYTTGQHSLKAGVNYRYTRDTSLDIAPFTFFSLFTFNSLRDLATGEINSTSGSTFFRFFTASPVLHLRLYNVGAYVQDQWTATPRLKITASVRFDRSGNPYCQDHCFARLIQPFEPVSNGLSLPYNASIQTGLSHAFYNIEPIIPQPRISIVYSPAFLKGTVFRGGIGEFSDLYPGFISELIAQNAPYRYAARIQTGLVNTGGAGSSPVIAAASANAFQTQFASGATLAQVEQAVAPASFGPPFYYSMPSTLRTPKVLEWSAEIQHQLGAKSALTVQYRGNHGYDIFMIDQNANASVDPSVYPNGFAGLPMVSPDPRFGSVWQLMNNGYSNYNGLATIFRRAFDRGFQGQISYTWSHAVDTLSNVGLSQFNGFGPFPGQISSNARLLNYSNADYDVRHNVTGDFIWEVPFKSKNRLMNVLLRGWSIGSKLSAHTGTPFTVINSGVGGLNNFDGTVLADVIDPNIHTTCGHTAINMPCFTANQFVLSGSQADLGNLPRNSFRGPGYFNIDSSIYRTVPIGERMRFTFGASAYNLLNHPNFLDPNADVAGSGLGLITGTAANPSGPYGSQGYSGTLRAVVVTGKFAF